MAKSIMVINDTAEILMLFEELLVGEGYRVSLHSYGTQDLETVKAIKPDLIISDHVPTREEIGWQFMQKLKMSRETAKIPLIICTTNITIVRENEGRLGEKGILVVPKPFDIEELLLAVKQLIGGPDESDPMPTTLNLQADPERDTR